MSGAEKFFLKQRDRFPEFIRFGGRDFQLYGYKLLGGGYLMGYTDINYTLEDCSFDLPQNLIQTNVSIKGDKPMIIDCGEFGEMVCEPDEYLAVERIISDFTRKFNGLSEYKVILREDTRNSKETLYEKSV